MVFVWLIVYCYSWFSSLFDFSVSCLDVDGYGCYLRFVCFVCFGMDLVVFVCMLLLCV